jgi:MOSC domain-containing protein YiiM
VQSGAVESVFVTGEAGGEPRAVTEALAVPGRGLEGDRYFFAEGTFSDARLEGRNLTLIEAEAIEALAAETGIELRPGDARRNVVTRGLSLNDLVGKRFRIGGVECVGAMLCDPCRHLERLTQPGVLKGLAGRGGLRADVLSEGRIAPGTAISELSG